MTKWLITDVLLQANDICLQDANPGPIRWLDFVASPSGLPHWTTSGYYGQLYDTEAIAQGIVDSLRLAGHPGYVVSVTV